MLTTRQHPSLETMAAFAEGRLAGEDTSQLAEHLSQCRECYALFAATAEFVEEERPEEEALPREGFRPWPLLAAAAVLILTIGVVLIMLRPRADTMTGLVAAANDLPYRMTTGRLSGDFERRPLLSTTRAADDPSQDPEWMKLQGAVSRSLEPESGAGAQEQAAALLLIGRNDRAIQILRDVVKREPRNAAAWNDLSVALLEQGKSAQNPDMIAEALTAAETALGIDDELPEAIFNRAVILEEIGRLDEAAAVWNRYLTVDPRSRWAEEARRQLEGR
ncbi:MAG TPA: tetratricopeptide repeat protein [Thermoanaerobaculia bacterium]|nr:tetratricopeptide repeat protein [Thermoanaerobaculia bacterium]